MGRRGGWKGEGRAGEEELAITAAEERRHWGKGEGKWEQEERGGSRGEGERREEGGEEF